MKESQLQQAIKDALVLAGFRVLHTSAHRQKGPSGVSPGVPDLLVTHQCCKPNWLGIEVKTDKGRLSPAQKELADLGMVKVARSPREAAWEAWKWLCWNTEVTDEVLQYVNQAKRVYDALDKEDHRG